MHEVDGSRRLRRPSARRNRRWRHRRHRWRCGARLATRGSRGAAPMPIDAPLSLARGPDNSVYKTFYIHMSYITPSRHVPSNRMKNEFAAKDSVELT